MAGLIVSQRFVYPIMSYHHEGQAGAIASVRDAHSNTNYLAVRRAWYVDKVTFDTTSILEFITRRFDLEPLAATQEISALPSIDPNRACETSAFVAAILIPILARLSISPRRPEPPGPWLDLPPTY